MLYFVVLVCKSVASPVVAQFRMVLHVRVAVVRLCLSKRLSSKAPLAAEIVQAEKLTKLAQVQQPTHLMQNLPSRTAITGAGMFIFILRFLKVRRKFLL